jgi:cytochrome c oxidase subunit IV
MSVLLPTLLLVWGVIAFFQEGNSWRRSRNLINTKNKQTIEAPKQTSWNRYIPTDTKVL